MKYNSERACKGRNVVYSSQRMAAGTCTMDEVLLDLMWFAEDDYGTGLTLFERAYQKARQRFLEELTDPKS